MKEFQKGSIFTQQIYNRIVSSKPGDVILYEELEELVGMSVQGGKSKAGYGYCMSARQRALNDDEIVTRAVANVGIEHIVDSKKADVGYRTISSLRRKSKKGIKEISSVRNFSEFTNTQKIMHNTARSILGMFEYLTRPKKVAMLESSISLSDKSLSFNETIKMFE